MTQINFENRLPAGVVTAKEIESANGVPESSNASDKWQECGDTLKSRIAQASLEMKQIFHEGVQVWGDKTSDPIVAKQRSDAFELALKRFRGLKKREKIIGDIKNSCSDKVFQLQQKSMGVNVFSHDPSDSVFFGDIKSEHGQKRFESLKTKLQDLGIAELGRFRDLTNIEVEQLIADRDPNAVDERPLALVVYPTADGNGAYASNEIVDLLLQGYRVVYVQAKTDNDCFDAIETYGQKQKIDLLFIGGHGTPRKTQFSQGLLWQQNQIARYTAAIAGLLCFATPATSWLGVALLGNFVLHSEPVQEYLEDSSFLDLQDLEKIKKRNLAQYLNADAQINLISCSTGKPDPSKNSAESDNMANMLAEAFQVPVYAPTADAGSRGIRFDAKGKLIGVDYGSAKDNEIISVETYIAFPK